MMTTSSTSHLGLTCDLCSSYNTVGVFLMSCSPKVINISLVIMLNATPK